MITLPIFLPLLSFFICLIFSNTTSNKILSLISCLIITVSATLSVFLMINIIENNGVFSFYIFKWLASGNLLSNWSINIDFFTAIMISTVNIVSALVQIYSIEYMKDEKNKCKFFCYMSLFTFFMLFLVSSGNLLQLYFGWEGVGLCSYLLIGFWFHKESARNAAIKAFIVNRIGDFFFILGIILIYITFKSIHFEDIFQNINTIKNSYINFFQFEIDLTTVICLFLLLGAMGKSAQLGLHTWLPDAMEGPTPVSALIHAATMVTAGVFLLCKMSVFFNNSLFSSNIIILIGSLTAFFAATVAITQNDIKRIIAYSTCSQLGMMFIAAGLSLYKLAIFHLVTHAFFKSLLFLGAGNIIHALNGEQNIKNMGGLKNKMPLTYIFMVIGSLALCGVPFFSGYFSKETIINSILNSDLMLAKFAYLLSIIAILLTSIYSFRLILLVFHGKNNFIKRNLLNLKEPSLIIIFPLIILSIFSISSGYLLKDFFINDSYSKFWLNSNVINILKVISHHDLHLIDFIPTILVFLGISFTFYTYLYNKEFLNKLIFRFPKIYYFFKHQWLIDDFYNKYFVKKTFIFANELWHTIDNGLIDKLGPNGVAFFIRKISKYFSSLQTGYIYHYAFSFIIGITLLISFIIFFFFN